ncbi:MAG: ferrochelatase [Myxococcaceae bacterium]
MISPLTEGEVSAPAVHRRTGVLLVNVGSPESPTTPAVRKYLRQFLGDPRVLDMNAAARWALLNLIILPTRPSKSAYAYGKVWMKEGAPLVHYSTLQRDALAAKLPETRVYLAMRYGKPSIPDVLDQIDKDDVETLCVLPMYPQYASASTTTAMEEIQRQLSRRSRQPALRVVPPFYDAPGFLDAAAGRIREKAKELNADAVLFSYHGLPQRQVRACGSERCFTSGCCDQLGPANHACYRAQCMATSRELARRIDLKKWDVSFQSRLGRDPWIEPNTEAVLPKLAKEGVKRLVVACPSFVADCLETLEEIGIRARDLFKDSGGEDLALVPCVNDDPVFIDGLAVLARRALGISK